MDNSKKLYVQALNYYNDGNLSKSMVLCEKSISLNIKNTSAINLKGLLYYLRGDLNNARILWKMNAEVNRDSVSKKYLQDSRKDEERQNLYNSALMQIKELRINEALEILNHCAESDYNVINVNNNISQCYIRKGDYEKAIDHINKVLGIDKKNEEALKNRRTMVQYGMIKPQANLKPIIMGVLALSLVIVIIYFGNIAVHRVRSINLIKAKDK